MMLIHLNYKHQLSLIQKSQLITPRFKSVLITLITYLHKSYDRIMKGYSTFFNPLKCCADIKNSYGIFYTNKTKFVGTSWLFFKHVPYPYLIQVYAAIFWSLSVQTIINEGKGENRIKTKAQCFNSPKSLVKNINTLFQ